MHFSNDYGYGLVNAYNAVRMAEVWSLFTPAQTTRQRAQLVQHRRRPTGRFPTSGTADC